MEDGEREKRDRVDSFTRGELPALLRMFSSLGIVVAGCIVGFFLLGQYVGARVAEMGWRGGGALRAGFLLGGVALGVYWAYLRIIRHLERYDRNGGAEGESK